MKMRVAIGLKGRIGRAILVAVGAGENGPQLIQRVEIKLLPERSFAPYHAVEGLNPAQARESVQNSLSTAHALADQAIHDVTVQIINLGHKLSGCGVLIGKGLPNWTTEDILAAHVRMHQAEGELFRNVLVDAAKKHKLKLTTLPHLSPLDAAALQLRVTRSELDRIIASIGKQAGPPWGQHQKEAAAAALAALGL